MHGTIVGIHSLMFYFYFAASNAQLSANVCYHNDTNSTSYYEYKQNQRRYSIFNSKSQ